VIIFEDLIEKLTDLVFEGKVVDSSPAKCNQGKLSESPKIFLPDDNIIHTQESQAQEGDACIEEMVPQEARIPNVPNNGIERAPMMLLQDRRRSERLFKDTTLTTKEKTERMTKKKT
jgi:hypothetical protein